MDDGIFFGFSFSEWLNLIILLTKWIALFRKYYFLEIFISYDLIRQNKYNIISITINITIIYAESIYDFFWISRVSDVSYFR